MSIIAIKSQIVKWLLFFSPENKQQKPQNPNSYSFISFHFLHSQTSNSRYNDGSDVKLTQAWKTIQTIKPAIGVRENTENKQLKKKNKQTQTLNTRMINPKT